MTKAQLFVRRFSTLGVAPALAGIGLGGEVFSFFWCVIVAYVLLKPYRWKGKMVKADSFTLKSHLWFIGLAGGAYVLTVAYWYFSKSAAQSTSWAWLLVSGIVLAVGYLIDARDPWEWELAKR